MIKLQLKFESDGKEQTFEHVEGELLSDLAKRVLKDVPEAKVENFNFVVNGNIVDGAFHEKVLVKDTDNILVSPKIAGGDSGQFFKQALLIVVVAVASFFFPPAAGLANAFIVAGITIGASLVLNHLIPPPVPDLGGALGGGGSIENSQMYSVSGQSNQAKRLGSVPKVFGVHRMYPTLAATPYVEIATSPGRNANVLLDGLIFTAKTNGTKGNGIILNVVNGGNAGSETVSVSGKTVNLVCKVGVSTLQQVYNKLTANSAFNALCYLSVIGEGTETFDYSGQTKMDNGEDPGETIQYFNAIYDFGMGTMAIQDIKIGDTPLDTVSFQDYEMRLVDPNRPDQPEDIYDEQLEKTFKTYSGVRNVTNLAIDLLADGAENIQVSDENTLGSPQDIICDFVCQTGLYGYSSSGSILNRTILMEIEFAPVGTSDWRGYNDPDVVDKFSIVGGGVNSEFDIFCMPDADSNYYSEGIATNGYAWTFSGTYGVNRVRQWMFKPNQNKLKLPVDDRLTVGSKVFHKGVLMGVITEINYLGNGKNQIVLDRKLPTGTTFLAFAQNGIIAGNIPTGSYGGYANVTKLHISRSPIGAAIVTNNKQAAVYASFRFTPKNPGQYQVRVRRISTQGSYGSQKADAITWTTITTNLRTSPIKTTTRHVFLELRLKATNQLNGNIDNLSAIVQSVLPYYDTQTLTWKRGITSNPAWVFAELMTGECNKKPVGKDRLHLPSLIEWAEFCDEVPTAPPGQEFFEPRFKCDFVLDYATTLQGVLGQVGSAAQASLNIIDGKYGVLIDKLKTVPVQIFTPRNSRDFNSARVYGPRPHALRIKYIDPERAWEVTEKIVYDDGYDENNATEFDDLESFACTNQEQAWRFGRYMLAQNRLRQETININVDFENLVCTRGDYVQICQDVMRVGGTAARVKAVAGNQIVIDDALDIIPGIDYGYVYRPTNGGAIDTSTLTPVSADTFDVDGPVPAVGDLIVIGEVGRIVYDCIVKSISPNDDMSAQLTLVEKADDIYLAESSSFIPPYNPQISQTSDPNKPPKIVLNLTLSETDWEVNAAGNDYVYFADVSWDVPEGSVFEYFEIWVNDGTGYKLTDTTTSKTYRHVVPDERLGFQHGLKVAAVAASGKKLPLIEMPEVIFTPEEKTEAPSNVTNFAMSITNQVLQLSWSLVPDIDIARYEIRYSPENNDVWESSIPLTSVNKFVDSVAVQARAGVYLIKAVDLNGNFSAQSAEVITTIPKLFELNIVVDVDDAPVFGGEKVQTEELGDAIILQREVIGADAEDTVYYASGYYTMENIVDLDEVFTCRLQSNIRADGYKFGEVMSSWEHLSDVEHLNTAQSSDWNVEVEYRATDVFAAMSDWAHLSEIDHINQGAGIGFTEWRPIPTTGDATGRIFQFRVRLESLTPNVTPRLFSSKVRVDMPDRIDSYENLVSNLDEPFILTYDNQFKGPGDSPAVQISIDGAESGDYWTFENKTLAGFSIRFFDKNDVQVVRQFDVMAKGYGRRHTTTI